MQLITDYSTKTFTVQHSDGKSEGFKTLAALYAAYPELDRKPLRKQTKLERRQERIDGGMKV